MSTVLRASLLVTLLLFVTLARAQSDCGIIYGNNWAFAFETPAGWTPLCGAEQQIGAPLALWHKGHSFADSPAVMYVNVSSKDEPSLPEFVKLSQNLFRQQAPGVVFKPLKPIEGTTKLTAMYFSATGDPGGNVERITYVEGATAYFIVVLSARNAKALQRAQPSYRKLVQSFIPMAASIQK